MRLLSQSENLVLISINNNLEQSLSVYACKNGDAIREFASKYDDDVLRTQYSIDIDKILHSALYNRGSDKTQVFSFYRNDDITRRSLHMQLVSRIARILGKALSLNLDLIEAIAIGHDVGHTPFGHKGEKFLNELYNANTGRHFNHNVHSVRVLQKILNCNLTLQTLDGILCHCGEKAFEKYEPSSIHNFVQFNEIMERCYTEKELVHTLRPSTLEGCVVRISDMIAYIGKDRQDAKKAKLQVEFSYSELGDNNPAIISTIVTDIIANSMNKSYLSMSPDVFCSLSNMLNENNQKIYQRAEVVQPYDSTIQPMMKLLYERFLNDLDKEKHDSLIYKHFLNETIVGNFYRHPTKRYVQKQVHDLNDIVTDFIASMTDDYFIDAFKFLFPAHELADELQYIEYFDKRYI